MFSYGTLRILLVSVLCVWDSSVPKGVPVSGKIPFGRFSKRSLQLPGKMEGAQRQKLRPHQRSGGRGQTGRNRERVVKPRVVASRGPLAICQSTPQPGWLIRSTALFLATLEAKRKIE